MDKKEFVREADHMVSGLMAEAYGSLHASRMECTRDRNGFRCSLGLGWIHIGAECYQGAIRFWWTGAMSIRPNYLEFYKKFGRSDDHEDVLEKARKCLEASFERLSEGHGYRFPARFTWPMSVWEETCRREALPEPDDGDVFGGDIGDAGGADAVPDSLPDGCETMDDVLALADGLPDVTDDEVEAALDGACSLDELP